MNRSYTLKNKNGTGRVVTEFPWMSRQSPCPWDDNKYTRVMIPFNATEQKKYRHPKQHIQVVRRDRLSVIRTPFGR